MLNIEERMKHILYMLSFMTVYNCCAMQEVPEKQGFSDSALNQMYYVSRIVVYKRNSVLPHDEQLLNKRVEEYASRIAPLKTPEEIELFAEWPKACKIAKTHRRYASKDMVIQKMQEKFLQTCFDSWEQADDELRTVTVEYFKRCVLREYSSLFLENGNVAEYDNIFKNTWPENFEQFLGVVYSSYWFGHGLEQRVLVKN